ncbi:hypothetical protein D210916BOD24_10840 [Alteromonas sp. D210916BOD_24]|uniref:hypothetical protein n=1 Tax=Alteromonas sp. D210916BOD_24 TaxID=3157618 RepID=UPI00399C5DCC
MNDMTKKQNIIIEKLANSIMSILPQSEAGLLSRVFAMTKHHAAAHHYLIQIGIYESHLKGCNEDINVDLDELIATNLEAQLCYLNFEKLWHERGFGHLSITDFNHRHTKDIFANEISLLEDKFDVGKGLIELILLEFAIMGVIQRNDVDLIEEFVEGHGHPPTPAKLQALLITKETLNALTNMLKSNRHLSKKLTEAV